MRSRTRRILRALAVVVLLLAVIAGVFVGIAMKSGATQEWLGRQIIGIANSYLEPQLACESVRYEAPYTVHLSNAEWIAPDGTRVFEVDRLTITLAELPKRGEPIRIESVEIDSGTVNLVQKEDGSGLKGLSPVAKVKPGRVEDVEAGVDEQFKLSNVLALRKLKLTNGLVRYEPAGDAPPMVLKDLALDLDIKPSADGAYNLVLDTGPRPGGRLRTDTVLNLDTMHLRLNSAEITIDVNDQSISNLPPPMQKLLMDHDAAGRLSMIATGEFGLLDAKNADIALVVDLEGFNVAFGDLHLPIELLHANLKFTEQRLDLGGFNTTLLDGKVTALASVNLDPTRGLSEFSWYLNQLDLELLLRSDDPEAESKIAGRLSGGGELNFDIANLPGSLAGKADLRVRDGTLVMLPGLTRLAAVMNATLGGDEGKNQTADFEYLITPKAIEITSAEIKTGTLLARGEGRINYDGTLQINARGGPVERIAEVFGKVGEAIGSVTERGATYMLRGKILDPEVTVAPLGIGSKIDDESPENASSKPDPGDEGEGPAEGETAEEPIPESESEPADEPVDGGE